jgi:lipid-A-disaccharide synthase
MLKASRHFPNEKFVVAKAPGIDDTFYREIMSAYPEVDSVHNETYALLQKAAAAMVTSGTATLETGLIGVPQIVCYKGNPISYRIAKKILTIKYISLVNLILDKQVVKELIQEDFTADNLCIELDQLLNDQGKREMILHAYAQLRDLLTEEGGNASQKAAEEIKKALMG